MAYLVVCDGRPGLGANQIWYDSENSESIRHAIEKLSARMEQGLTRAGEDCSREESRRPAMRRVSTR